MKNALELRSRSQKSEGEGKKRKADGRGEKCEPAQIHNPYALQQSYGLMIVNPCVREPVAVNAVTVTVYGPPPFLKM